MLDQWRSMSYDDHIHRDIVQQCQRLLLAIFGYIAFNYDLEAPTGNELTRALHDFLPVFTTSLYMPPFMSKIYWKISSKYRKAISIIRQYLGRMIEQEQNESTESMDERKRTSLIASLVLSMQKDESIEATKSEEEKKGLSHDEIVHEMLLFLVAGFETTSSALAWFIHLMSKNPRVQTKLKAELAENSFSMDRLDSLVYLDAVIREVLRFAPPVNSTIRTLTADDRLPISGAQLYKGDQVSIPFYNLARDPRYWKVDPELFYPERFLENGLDQDHHPYAWVPFGGGHRQCIGQDLARFELKTIAARLMQYVTFGDGGSDVNSGGREQQFTIIPKYVGVTIFVD
jgi:cytochrome P450